MYQICYASESTSDDTLLDDLAAILTEARNFNSSHYITGALYFADGYFFQCIEGSRESLEFLMSKLKKDPRHKNLHIFETQVLKQRMFNDWVMKYVQRHGEIQDFMHELGYSRFAPQHLTQENVNSLVQLLGVVLQQEETV